MSWGEVLPAVFQFLLVTGVAFLAISLLTSLVRYQNIVAPAAGTDDAVASSASLEIHIAQRLGTGPRERTPFLVFLVDLRPDEAERALARIRECVRSPDAVLQLAEGPIGIVMDAPRHVAGAIGARITKALGHAGPGGPEIRPRRDIAMASFPEDGDRADAVLVAVRDALESPAGVDAGLRISSREPRGDAPATPPTTPEDPMAGAAPSQRRLLDETTGLLRAEHLDGVLRKRFSQARREGHALSVICMQIDHLERYRDHYGATGIDSILGHLGCFLQGAMREEDLPCRYEEDRFVLIMGCSPASALQVATRLGAGIGDLGIEVAGASVAVTVTSGIAGYPDHGGVPRQVLGHAVSAQESAKAKGRNQAQLFNPGMAGPVREPRSQAETF